MKTSCSTVPSFSARDIKSPLNSPTSLCQRWMCLGCEWRRTCSRSGWPPPSWEKCRRGEQEFQQADLGLPKEPDHRRRLITIKCEFQKSHIKCWFNCYIFSMYISVEYIKTVSGCSEKRQQRVVWKLRVCCPLNSIVLSHLCGLFSLLACWRVRSRLLRLVGRSASMISGLLRSLNWSSQLAQVLDHQTEENQTHSAKVTSQTVNFTQFLLEF